MSGTDQTLGRRQAADARKRPHPPVPLHGSRADERHGPAPRRLHIKPARLGRAHRSPPQLKALAVPDQRATFQLVPCLIPVPRRTAQDAFYPAVGAAPFMCCHFVVRPAERTVDALELFRGLLQAEVRPLGSSPHWAAARPSCPQRIDAVDAARARLRLNRASIPACAARARPTHWHEEHGVQARLRRPGSHSRAIQGKRRQGLGILIYRRLDARPRVARSHVEGHGSQFQKPPPPDARQPLIQ